MVESMIEHERSGTHEKQMMMLPPLPDIEHFVSSSPNDALRTLILFAETSIESEHQHGDDNRIVAVSALRLVTKLLHSEKLAILIEALKMENAVCDFVSLMVQLISEGVP